MVLTDLQKRLLLFLFGCVPTRALLVYVATTRFKRELAALLALPMIGFFYLYSTNSRLTGPETYGQPIWWKELRVVHGLLYAWFILNVLMKVPQAAMPLAFDLIFGVLAFLAHHIGCKK